MNNPLILLHGALGAKEQLAPWMDALSSSREVHSLNFEGHGTEPSNSRPFRIEFFAENVLAYMDANGISQADFLGYSMGGYVAAYLASIAIERVGKIITFATKLNWDPETSAREVKMLDARRIADKVPAFAKTLEERHTGMGWENHLAATAEMMIHLGNSPVIDEAFWPRVPHPICFGIGDRDNMVSLEETIMAYRLALNGSLLVLPNTGHPIEKIRIQLLLPYLHRFLQD